MVVKAKKKKHKNSNIEFLLYQNINFLKKILLALSINILALLCSRNLLSDLHLMEI